MWSQNSKAWAEQCLAHLHLKDLDQRKVTKIKMKKKNIYNILIKSYLTLYSKGTIAPGPGQYSPKLELNDSGKYYLSKFKSNNGRSFPHFARQSIESHKMGIGSKKIFIS